MPYGSEASCFRQNDIVTLRRIDMAMVCAMCGVKLVDKISCKFSTWKKQ